MPLFKQFCHYVAPSLISYAVLGIYVIVDGLFVGNAVGDAGLAGVSIANPIYTVIMSSGIGIGVGGAVISSIKVGEGKGSKARDVEGTTATLLLIASFPIMAVSLAFSTPLNAFLGGSGESLRYAVEYTNVLAIGAPFQLLASGLLPIIRNRGHVRYAMVVSMLSCLVNASLDWVFVMQMGMGTAGAATATVCAQAFSFAGCLSILLRKSQRIPAAAFAPKARYILHIAKIGFAPFSLNMLPVVGIAVMNINARACGGELAVAAYGVVASVTFLVQILIQAVGDGAQPLISRNLGEGNLAAVKSLRRMNYAGGISIGLLGLAAFALLNEEIPTWYGVSDATAAITAHALPIFAVAYIFYGFTHASTTFFYATDDALRANSLVCAEAVLVAPAAVGLSSIMGLDGVWWSIACVQAALSVGAAVLLKTKRIAAA